MPSKPLRYAALVALVALLAWVLLHRAAPPPPAPPAPPPHPAPVAEPAPVTPVAPVAPSPLAPDASVAPAPPAPTAVVRGAWGSHLGEFGRTTESEANPEGPMSFALAPDGTVAVLDQRNRRVQRFVAGRAVTTADLDNEAAQDLALTPSGALVVLDRLGASTLTVYGPDGRATAPIALRGGAITEGGAVTGVFADAQGIYVEREHREVVRVADANGREDPDRPTLWGRPSRDGAQLLRASIEDPARGVLRVSVAARANGAMDWSSTVSTDAPVLYLAMLDSDARGRVYVAAATGRASPDGARDVATFVARLDGAGAVEATMTLPALAGGDEVFRPMRVDDEGAVYVMAPSREGVEITRYSWVR